MKQCTHARKGIVTNQPDRFDPNRPHASRQVCDRPGCVAAGKSWAASITNETAYFIPDANRSARL